MPIPFAVLKQLLRENPKQGETVPASADYPRAMPYQGGYLVPGNLNYGQALYEHDKAQSPISTMFKDAFNPSAYSDLSYDLTPGEMEQIDSLQQKELRRRHAAERAGTAKK